MQAIVQFNLLCWCQLCCTRANMTLSLEIKSISMTTKMKPTKQTSPVLLFIVCCTGWF